MAFSIGQKISHFLGFAARSGENGRVARNFLSDQRGGSLVLFAAAVVPVILCVGAAVDYSEAVRVRQGIVTALDSATLATARDLSFGRIEEDEATASLIAHYRNAMKVTGTDSRAHMKDPLVAVDTDTGRIVSYAQSSLNTAFMHLAGVKTMDIAVQASADYVNTKLEIALVVDATGSMNERGRDRYGRRTGEQKIVELRRAVEKDFLDILFDGSPASRDGRIKVSLIPYNEGVDLGADVPKSLKALPFRCAAETGSGSLSDDAPSAVHYFGQGRTCARNSGLVPLTDDPDTIVKRLRGITAANSTAAHIGLQWGWNTISPRWAAEWPADARPTGYGNADVKKIVVFMTDGIFNTRYNRTGSYRVNGLNVARLQRKQNTGDARRASEQRATQACDDMSRLGVTVYTIAFDLAAGSNAEKVMQRCATDASKTFFRAGSGELGRAFESIAADVRRIWISS